MTQNQFQTLEQLQDFAKRMEHMLDYLPRLDEDDSPELYAAMNSFEDSINDTVDAIYDYIDDVETKASNDEDEDLEQSALLNS